MEGTVIEGPAYGIPDAGTIEAIALSAYANVLGLG